LGQKESIGQFNELPSLTIDLSISYEENKFKIHIVIILKGLQCGMIALFRL
jgi:hypothetical protein